MKKILIIVYYWPPAGGPGVQRWLKFVKYLPDFGFQPIVYVPDNPTYPIIDRSLESQIPQETIILRRKIFEPYGIASIFSRKKINKISSGIIPTKGNQTFLEKVALWIRGNLFIPDARIFWVKPSVKFLEKYINENCIDTVVTSGPPHSLHLIGMALKAKTNFTWIADFRDPWTTIGYHDAMKLSKFSSRKHKDLERQVLNAADRIIVTSATTKDGFREITSKPIDVITNGYDVAKIAGIKVDTKFSLSHIGSLLAGRNPKILWEALLELLNELPTFKDFLQIYLIGATSHEILDSIAKYRLGDYTEVTGYLSHADAVKRQQESQILLLIEIDSENTKRIIPGKLFEYMVSGRPILAIGPAGSDFSAIISETNIGIFVNYQEKDKLKIAITNYFKLFLDGNLKVSAVGIEKYSRKSLTQQLAAIINA